MRLPEQPGDGEPENETKGGQESPEGGEEPRRSPAPDFPTWQVFPQPQIPGHRLLCNSQVGEWGGVWELWYLGERGESMRSRWGWVGDFQQETESFYGFWRWWVSMDSIWDSHSRQEGVVANSLSILGLRGCKLLWNRWNLQNAEQVTAWKWNLYIGHFN